MTKTEDYFNAKDTLENLKIIQQALKNKETNFYSFFNYETKHGDIRCLALAAQSHFKEIVDKAIAIAQADVKQTRRDAKEEAKEILSRD